MRYALVLVVFLSLPVQARSSTIMVPGDHPTIQAAIDASLAGDLILVSAGTYVEHLDFKGKDVTVASEDGPHLTFIDGNGTISVARFNSGEGPDAVLEGFTLRNGTDIHGGGIFCHKASPTIRGNIVTACTATGDGGGIYLNEAAAHLMDNLIEDNTANVAGGIMCNQSSHAVISGNTVADNWARDAGGIGCYAGSSPLLEGNVIFGNRARNVGGGVVCVHDASPEFKGNRIGGNHALVGGGVVCYGGAASFTNNQVIGNDAGYYGGGFYCIEAFILMVNNTIAFNQAGISGGGLFTGEGNPELINIILWDNQAPQGPEAHVYSNTPATGLTIRHSDLEGGQGGVSLEPGSNLFWGPGMIDQNPGFVDPGDGDFHIRYDSPCRDQGDGAAPGLPAVDFEGDPRIALGTVDMGADEFHTHLYLTGDAVPGGGMMLKITDLPGTGPAGVFYSTQGRYDPPLPSPYGDWYLLPPQSFVYPMGTVPSPGGVLEIPLRIPGGLPPLFEVHLQAILGNPPVLTNPWTLFIK